MTVAELAEKLKEYPGHYQVRGVEHALIYKDYPITLIGKNIGKQEVYFVFVKD